MGMAEGGLRFPLTSGGHSGPLESSPLGLGGGGAEAP